MPTDAHQERTVILHDEGLRRLQGFTQIPNVVLTHATLTANAKITYGVLLSYAWQKDFCWPAQERLAHDMNCSIRAVQRYLTELEDGGLIRIKRRGLNRPNVYEILPITSWYSEQLSAKKQDTTDLSSLEATELPAPDTTAASGLEATALSSKEDTKEHIQVVNALTANDQKDPVRRAPIPPNDEPIISDRALRITYGLSDAQISRVHYLVDRQSEHLRSVERNFAYYVKRAAEAVRDGGDGFLDQMLSEFRQALVAKQTAKRTPVGSRAAFFHAMYAEGLQKRGRQTASSSIPAAPTFTHTSDNETPARFGMSELFARADEHNSDDARARLIADAERRGFQVPDYLRSADVRALNQWWAALVSEPENKT